MINATSIPVITSQGCSIPQIGFGTSQLGDCAELVCHALKLGYRHIDTAWKYGSEKGVVSTSILTHCKLMSEHYHLRLLNLYMQPTPDVRSPFLEPKRKRHDPTGLYSNSMRPQTACPGKLLLNICDLGRFPRN